MPRGRPPKELTGPELLRRYRKRTLVWCDENGEVAAGQTTPTGYVRALTKSEAKEAAAIAAVDAALADNPEFARCDRDGTPNPKGALWRLRDE
jgi:hypothetical protein